MELAKSSIETAGIEVAGSLVSGDIFRDLMRKLAASVTVITTENEGNLHGFTATAVCSVCAEPPTILIVVNRSARTHPHIDRRGAFAVNILAEEQSGIASHFASKTLDQFAQVEHTVTPRGVPVINEAAAFIECRVDQRHDVGTHTIFLGQVIGGGTEPSSPLIYQDAKFARAMEI